jgi:hypothetical protein
MFKGDLELKPELVGIYSTFYSWPIWLIVGIMSLLIVDILRPLRWKFERMGYNISLSSDIGDRCLILIVAIVATIMQRHSQANWSEWTTNWSFQLSVAGFAFLLTLTEIIQAIRGKKDTAVDRYHNLVILPELVFFLATSLPLIFQGSTGEFLVCSVLLMVWVRLFIYDVETGRLHQCNWLKKNTIRTFNLWHDGPTR